LRSHSLALSELARPERPVALEQAEHDCVSEREAVLCAQAPDEATEHGLEIMGRLGRLTFALGHAHRLSV
jgi:hypothetical protein